MSGVRPGKAKGPWVGRNPLAPPPDMDKKVQVTAADTTTDYLDAKLVTAGNLSKSILFPAGNEQLQVTDSATPTYTLVNFGDPTVDGSWRISVSGTDMIFERREAGSWIQKGAVTP